MPDELFSFTIPAGHSNCTHCNEFKECLNKVWSAFGPNDSGLAGVWTMWCDDCVRETGVEHEREEDPQPMRIVVVDDDDEEVSDPEG